MNTGSVPMHSTTSGRVLSDTNFKKPVSLPPGFDITAKENEDYLIYLTAGMEAKFPTHLYSDPTKFTAEHMKWIHHGFKTGRDMSPLCDGRYSARQIEWILKGSIKGINVMLFANEPENYSGHYMYVLYLMITTGMNVEPYLDYTRWDSAKLFYIHQWWEDAPDDLPSPKELEQMPIQEVVRRGRVAATAARAMKNKSEG